MHAFTPDWLSIANTSINKCSRICGGKGRLKTLQEILIIIIFFNYCVIICAEEYIEAIYCIEANEYEKGTPSWTLIHSTILKKKNNLNNKTLLHLVFNCLVRNSIHLFSGIGKLLSGSYASQRLQLTIVSSHNFNAFPIGPIGIKFTEF